MKVYSTSWVFVCAVGVATVACGGTPTESEPAPASDSAKIGKVTLELANVPSGILCIRANVDNSIYPWQHFVTSDFVVTSGSPFTGTLPIDAYETTMQVNASAYNQACTGITSPPLWVSDTVLVDFMYGSSNSVQLNFRQNLGIAATGNFAPSVTDVSVGKFTVGLRNQDNTIRLTGTTPAVPTTIPNIAELAVGSDHACVRKTDGSVWCWGVNAAGQLGNGTFTASPTTAVQVSTLGPGSGVTTIAAGEGTSCASTATTTYCWGFGLNGALGNNAAANSNVPVIASGLGASQKISTNQKHTCAISRAGDVWCWGTGNSGELGNGNGGNSNVPVQATGIKGAISVAVGDAHSCAVETSGRILCWGLNTSGQLGLGNNTLQSVPATLPPLYPSNQPIEVAAGSLHTCVRALVDGIGTVYCWGAGADGQVGDGTGVNQNQPMQVLTGVKQIRAGTQAKTSCALMDDISVQCWGDNSVAQFDSTKFNRYRPAPLAL